MKRSGGDWDGVYCRDCFWRNRGEIWIEGERVREGSGIRWNGVEEA